MGFYFFLQFENELKMMNMIEEEDEEKKINLLLLTHCKIKLMVLF